MLSSCKRLILSIVCCGLISSSAVAQSILGGSILGGSLLVQPVANQTLDHLVTHRNDSFFNFSSNHSSVLEQLNDLQSSSPGYKTSHPANSNPDQYESTKDDTKLAIVETKYSLIAYKSIALDRKVLDHFHAIVDELCSERSPPTAL